MKKKTIIILVIIIGAMIGFAMERHEEKEKNRSVMQDAVYIEDIDSIDESLVGKYVIISGVPMMEEGAYDADFDVQFDYPVVYRMSYVLYDTGTGSKHNTEWQQSYRSDDYPYGSTDLVGVARIGAYTFSGDTLKYVFETSTDTIVTEELAEQIGWTYCSNYKLAGKWLLSQPFTYPNDVENWLDRGMMRITYNAKSSEGIPCTIFGYLTEDGRITGTEEADIQYVKGIYDKEGFLEAY